MPPLGYIALESGPPPIGNIGDIFLRLRPPHHLSCQRLIVLSAVNADRDRDAFWGDGMRQGRLLGKGQTRVYTALKRISKGKWLCFAANH